MKNKVYKNLDRAKANSAFFQIRKNIYHSTNISAYM